MTGFLGIKGIRGDKGDKGEAGDSGDTGARGDEGAAGAPGMRGATGAKGGQGARGTDVAPAMKWVVAAVLIPPWMVFFLGVYWFFFDNSPPAEYAETQVFNILGDKATTFRPGEMVTVARKRCVEKGGTVAFSRMLISADRKFIHYLPGGEITLIAGCSTVYNYITIPQNVVPGDYVFYTSIHYRNNPISDSTVFLPSVKLTIAK